MVHATTPRHVVLLVLGLTALCVALPQTVMAIDLSRLYGHLNAKRNGESATNHAPPINHHHQAQLHSTEYIYALCCVYVNLQIYIHYKTITFLFYICLFLCDALFLIMHLCTFTCSPVTAPHTVICLQVFSSIN
ncbi:hypothetical protein C0J52_28208 [Blattella germanica]|nr:hypothetical protein C0J52_28208 [Blattella germanica]